MPVVLATDENVVIQPFCALAADLASANPTLYPHELAFETDTRRMKLGDISASTPYNSLPYFCEQNLFSSIAVAGQTTVTVNSITTALEFVASAGMTITTDNTSNPKQIIFAATSGAVATLSDGDYGDIIVSGTGTVMMFDSTVVTTAARTYLDDTTVADAVNTLFGATSTGTGGAARSTSPRITTEISPATNDGAALGTTSLMWSDLFLASGAVVNFNNGDVTLTYSSNTLTLGGGDLALGANNLALTGSIAATGSRVTKGWFTDLESTNAPTVSGSPVYYIGGPDVSLADGGTGASLADPNADRILFWDDSANSVDWLTFGSGLSISGTTVTSPDQVITLTGDVTGSGIGAFAATITNNAVTLAKMAQVTAPTFLGRTTAGTGNVEALTVTQATAMLNVFGGDSGSGGVKGLAPATVAGDAAKFLRGDGIWAAVSGASGGTVTSVSVITHDGVSGTVATPTTTPAISLTLDNIIPTSVNGLTITTTVGGVLTIGSGKTLTSLNILTFAGTDSSSVQFSQGGTVAYTANKLSVFAPTTSLELNSVISDNTGSGLLVFNDTPTITTPIVTNPTITGGTHTAITNLGIRSTGTGAFDLNIKNAENLTAGRNLTVVMGDANRTLTFAGDATISGVNSGDQLYTASGDATAPSSASNLALTLATVATAGTTGGSTAIPVITIDAKGRTLSITTAAVIAPANTLSGTTLNPTVTGSSLTSVGTLVDLTVTNTITGSISGNAGSATILQNARTINGVSFNGSANITIPTVIADGDYGDIIVSGTGTVMMFDSTVVTTAARTYLDDTTVADAVNTLGGATSTGTGGLVRQNTPQLNDLVMGGSSAPLITFTNGGGTTTGIIRAPAGNVDSLSLQAWNGTFFEAAISIVSIPSLGTISADLSSKTTIGSSYIYRNNGIDVIVADGGSGRSSATAYMPICGGTTSTNPHQSVSASGATAGMVLTFVSTSSLPTWQTVIGGGDFFGPNGATDNAVVRFDTTTGKLGQDSSLTISDTGVAVLGGSAASFKIGDSTAGILKFRDSTGADISITAGSNTLTVSGTVSVSATTFIGNLIGNASTATLLQNTRNIFGNSFNGGADVTGTIGVQYGGTGRVSATPYAPVCGGTATTAPLQSATTGNSGEIFVSSGNAQLPGWSTFGTLINIWGPTISGYDNTQRQFLTHTAAGAGNPIVYEWKNRVVC